MDEHILICIFIFLTGACIGSFLNVVALRALSKESIVLPSSKCPKCNTPIKWYDNIPILSYFLTFRGKCRSCGEKVSIQYPIVETLTALIFLAVFLAFGVSLKTLLLLILLCISIVIVITDIKEEAVFDIHSWIFIIFALIFSSLEYNLRFAIIGCIFAFICMEIVARISYYLIRKTDNNLDNDLPVNEKVETNEKEEKFDINTYVNKNKRAFGEGDTYLAAGVGALLGIKYFIIALACAILFQAICILPQFLVNLYKQGEKRLLVSLSLFIILAVSYFILSGLMELNLFVVFVFIIALIFFAIDSITRLKKSVNNNGFKAIPFGPSLLFMSFIVLFFAPYLIQFIKKFILFV